MAKRGANNGSGANLGLGAQLWNAADARRSNRATAEHNRIVLGLILLKYISDAFEDAPYYGREQ